MASIASTAMYLQLGRKVRTPSKKTGSGPSTADGHVLLEATAPMPLRTPYEFFYPNPPAPLSPPLVRSPSPEVAERTEVRKRKKEFFRQHAESFAQFETGNMVMVHKAFLPHVADDGTIGRAGFCRALAALDVRDPDLMERTFDLFDSSKEGVAEYEEVIMAMDLIVNGTNKHITAKDCFSLVDPTSCGYIIMNWLQELKHKRTESNEVTHMMVKTLLEIFDRLQLEEEERIMKERNKKGKKGKAEAAGPITWSKKIHLNFTEFSGFLAAEPLLVQAFLTRVLQTMEAVYFKNKSAVTGQSE